MEVVGMFTVVHTASWDASGQPGAVASDRGETQIWNVQ